MGKIDATSEAGKHTGEVNTLVFDKNHVYSGGADGVINVWDADLKFLRDIPIHKDFPVMVMCVNSQNQMYTCGRDGSLRYFRGPWKNNNNDIMLQTAMNDVTALYCVDDILYSGDDKGIVTKWYHNQVGSQYNVLEEVKSMAVEGTTLYTVCDLDVVATDINPGITKGMSYSTKGTMEGRAPMLLFGPVVDKYHKYVICITRDGKGISMYNNVAPFKKAWTKENAHEMIINVIIATEEALFTAGYDGKVKKWIISEKEPKLAEEIDVGKCVNTLCFGPDHSVYAGDASGLVKRLRFSK